MPDQRTFVDLVVKLAPAAARASSAHHSVRNCASQLGVALEQLDPGESESELASYYTARVESTSAPEVIQQLMRCEGVEGAYAKPRGQPPERNTHSA